MTSTVCNRVCRACLLDPKTHVDHILDDPRYRSLHCLRGGEGSKLHHLTKYHLWVSESSVADRMQLRLRRCRSYRLWGCAKGAEARLVKLILVTAQAKALTLATVRIRNNICYPAQSSIMSALLCNQRHMYAERRCKCPSQCPWGPYPRYSNMIR